MEEHEVADQEAFCAERKKAGNAIDPETAEYDWKWANIIDPYGVYPQSEECCIGRVWFAYSPETGSVCFFDLPEETLARMNERVTVEPPRDDDLDWLV